MKPTVVVLALLMGLTACVTPAPTVITKHYVLTIPDELYRCQVAKWPGHETLTEVQIVHLLKDLHEANVTCKTSIDGIRRYVEAAKRITAR